ncbi:hypothetical protein V8J36_08225 [Frigidibacter sp. MR17.14]|uniref:hypothetical protein n=1 Tax=Frigidibacter sp. MR17.14 TaxID=3126509 RepID=UPI0030131774
MSDTTGSSAGSLKASSLRERLRLDTRAAHDALDERLGTLDLQTPEHLAAFLAVQAEGFAVLRDGLSADAPEAALLDEMLAALATDLGHAPRAAVPAAPLDPLAVRYIALGSRLGTRVMAGRGGAALAASRYFALPPRGEDWKALVATLSAHPAGGPAADRIVRDAAACFDIFSAAAARLTTAPCAVPA